jgi:hypothetical protein
MRANIPIEGLHSDELLVDWAWLIRKPCTLIAMSDFGDMFLCDESGRIDFLELASGQITNVACTTAEFQRLATEKENQRGWFMTSLLTELELAGVTIANSQCFCYKIPPILGGKIEASNIEVGNIYMYSSLMGQLHQQVKNLPPGTKISGFKIK